MLYTSTTSVREILRDLFSATETTQVSFHFARLKKNVINSQWGDEREVVPVTTVVHSDGYPSRSGSWYALLTGSSSAVPEPESPAESGTIEHFVKKKKKKKKRSVAARKSLFAVFSNASPHRALACLAVRVWRRQDNARLVRSHTKCPYA